jgi:transcriptional regulator with XRE-family HTH domain
MTPEFWEWFESCKAALDLTTDRQAARKAGIASSVISKARTGVQPIGYEALAQIAKAFKTPTATVFRLAGLLEKEEPLTPEKAAWAAVFDELTPMDQEELLAIMRVRVKWREREAKQMERETKQQARTT